jgi:hypothetical protein
MELHSRLSFVKSYLPTQFALFRILFGSYLLLYFIFLIPYAPDIYSSSGMFSSLSKLSPFPNVLNWMSGPKQVQEVLALLAIVSTFYLLGFCRRLSAIVLWYGWASLINRMPYFAVPSEGYVGWLLLVSAVLPSGEPLSLTKRIETWQMPKVIFYGAWTIIALSYTCSGIDKLSSPSWLNGSALQMVFESPMARTGAIVNFFSTLPPSLLRLLTWGALGVEILFAPFCIFAMGRKLIWFAMVGMHLGILMTLNITSVSIAMLLTHLFIFDTRWLRRCDNSFA